MASSDDSPPKLPKRDSRLENFLRRAAPVIAAERGMTPSATIKLQAIADELLLPPELYQEAMTLLQQGPPQVRKHDRYERAYMAYLEKELTRRSSEILTYEIEQKALKVGESKYQLEVARARELFALVAKKIGKRRISATEAERHVETTIREVVHDAVWVDIETRQRLIVLGEEWGISKEHVAATVELYCRINRDKQKSDQQRTNLLVALVGLTVIGVIIGLLVVSYRRMLEPEGDSTETVAENEDDSSNRVFTPPDWWDNAMRTSVANALPTVSGFSEWGRDLASSDLTKREQACQRLVTTLSNASGSRDATQRLQAVLFGVLALEPDEGIFDRTTRLITSSARAPSDGLPSGDDFYRRGWNTIELLAVFTSDDAYPLPRREKIRLELSDLTGTLAASEGVEGLNQYRHDYIEANAEHLLAHASSNPAVAIQRFEQLTLVGREVVNEEERRLWLTELAVELLRSSTADWQRYRTLLDTATLRSNESNIPALLEFIEIPRQPDLADYLAQRLKDNYRLTVTTDAPDEVAMALRQHLGLSAAVVDRAPSFLWNQLGSKLTATTPGAGWSRDQQAKALVELAFLNTQAMRLVVAPADATKIAETLSTGAPELTLSEAAESEDSPEPVAVDGESLERLADRIRNLDGASVTSASATIRTLGRTLAESQVLHGRRDLAEPVATYLLSSRDSAEQRSILSLVPGLYRWPDLHVAIADGLDSPRVRIETAVEMIRTLHSADLELSPTTNDIPTLQRRLLATALTLWNEDETRGASAAADASGVNELDDCLVLVFDQRRQTLGGSATVGRSEFPSQELRLALIQWLVWARKSHPELATNRVYIAADRELKALSYLAQDEVQATVAVQRLWVELLAEWISVARPEESVNAKRLWTEYDERANKSTDSLDQLLDAEMTMIRLWMVMR